MTEKQQQRLQVCKNNWVRKIIGVKKVNRGRMDELTEEIGVQVSLIWRLGRSQLKWGWSRGANGGRENGIGSG